MRLFLISVFVTILAVLALATEAAPPAGAPTPNAEASVPAPTAEVPPGRVGRLSLVSGSVSVRASNGWADAVLNLPLSAGGSLRTGAQARAEIEIGADTIDLSSDTEIEITTLNDLVMRVAVARGRIGLSLTQLGAGESVEVGVSGQDVALVEPGRYDGRHGAPRRPPGDCRDRAGSTRRLHRVVRVARFRREAPCRSLLHFPVHDRLCRTRCGGKLGERRGIRCCVGSHWVALRLGALSRRPLALDRPLGLDLDRRSALGICSVSLRPLGLYRRALGLGPGQLCRASGLCPGRRRLPGNRRGRAEYRRHHRAGHRLVPARPR